jgi:septal ring factor EnvC (AmiA/AmiB activator)
MKSLRQIPFPRLLGALLLAAAASYFPQRSLAQSYEIQKLEQQIADVKQQMEAISQQIRHIEDLNQQIADKIPPLEARIEYLMRQDPGDSTLKLSLIKQASSLQGDVDGLKSRIGQNNAAIHMKQKELMKLDTGRRLLQAELEKRRRGGQPSPTASPLQ